MTPKGALDNGQVRRVALAEDGSQGPWRLCPLLVRDSELPLWVVGGQRVDLCGHLES